MTRSWKKTRAGLIQKRPDPPPPRVIAARNAVFAIGDLLEMILLELDMQTILVGAQRVCRFWRQLVIASSRLQRRLFFAPDPQLRCVDASLMTEQQRPVFNPLLRTWFSEFYPDFDRATTEERSRAVRPLRDAIVPWHFYIAETYWPTTPFENRRDCRMRIAETKQGSERYYAIARKSASWRRMLVSQPPPMTIARLGDIKERWCSREWSWDGAVWAKTSARLVQRLQRKMVTLPDGLRMEELLDVMWSGSWDRESMNQYEFAWCAWNMHSPPPRVARPLQYSHWVPEETEIAKWASAADLIIGGRVPTTFNYRKHFDSYCWYRCPKETGGTMCGCHQWAAKRYELVEHNPHGPLCWEDPA